MTTMKQGQDAYYNDLHNKNLPAFKEMIRAMMGGLWKIISIRIDKPEFGHRRVVIFFHDAEEQ